MIKLNTLPGLEKILDSYVYKDNLISQLVHNETKRVYFFEGILKKEGKVEIFTRKQKTFLFKTGIDTGILVKFRHAQTLLATLNTDNFVEINKIERFSVIDDGYFFNKVNRKAYKKENDKFVELPMARYDGMPAYYLPITNLKTANTNEVLILQEFLEHFLKRDFVCKLDNLTI